MHRLGRFTVRRRRILLLAALLVFLASAFIGSGTMNALVLSRFEAPGSESIVAGDELDRRFGVGSANFLLLVTAADGDVDSAASAAAGAALAAEVASTEGIAQVDSYWDAGSPALRSEDGSQALITAYVPGDVTYVRSELLPELKAAFAGDDGTLTVAVGGSDEMFREAAELAREDFVLAEAIIIPGMLVLLIVLYRRPVAAFLTLGVGIFALALSLAAMRAVAAMTEVSTFAANLILVMSMGLAVDYCLFIVNRFREESALHDRAEAVARTVASAGRTVVFSAVTVAASLSVLLLMPFPFLQSFGYAGIVVPLAALLGAVVVLPAALAVWGGRVVRKRPVRPVEAGRWFRLASGVMRRPFVWGGAALVLVLTLASPMLGVRFGVADERVLPEGAESRVVTDQVTEGFAAEETDAFQILVEGSDVESLAAYATELSTVDGIAQVDSGAGRFVDGAAVAAGDTERFAESGGATWLSAVPTMEVMREDPYGLVGDVRAVDADFTTSVSGYPADLTDFRDALLERLPLVIGLIVLITFVILFLMTGSVIAPIKATVLNGLSLAVMFGAMIWVFQEGHLSGLIGFTPQGSFEPSIPILMFCIAYGLSMDYEVFMLSRIKEEHDRTGDRTGSIAVGLQRSAPLVTAAAVVLAFSFAVYASGDMVFLQMLGLGMALAVLVDATVIRGVLLPALMRLTGRWNWWAPAPLRRLHERIGLRDLESRVDHDRFGVEADAEGRFHAVGHFGGQAQDVGRARAAPVGQREGVLCGQTGVAPPVALLETGRADEPRRRDLDAALIGLPVRRFATGALNHLVEVRRTEDRVGEERTRAPRVVVAGVQDHALAPPQRQHRVTDQVQRRPLAHLDAEPLRQLRVGDRPGLRALLEPEVHAEHQVPVGVLEDAVAVGEPAFGRGPVADLVGLAVPHLHRRDGLRDLLAVRAHVLDRRRTGRTGNAAQALHAREAVRHGPRHELVPHMPGLHPHQALADPLDALAAQQHHRALEPRVADDHVRAAAQHQRRPGRRADRRDGLRPVAGLDQLAGRTSYPQRRVLTEGFARNRAVRGRFARHRAGVCHTRKPKLYAGYEERRSPWLSCASPTTSPS